VLSFFWPFLAIFSTFFARIFCTNFWRQVKFQLGAKNLYEKREQKVLMKLTVGVNLTNSLLELFCTKVFCAAFLYFWLCNFVAKEKWLAKCWLN